MNVTNDQKFGKFKEAAAKEKHELVPMSMEDILGKTTKKKPNKKMLKTLVNKPALEDKEHKFQIFLEKPTDADRMENINIIARVVHLTNGLVMDMKIDHNEMFDTMTLSWKDSVINHRLAVIHPMALVNKFYCVQMTKRLEE